MMEEPLERFQVTRREGTFRVSVTPRGVCRLEFGSADGPPAHPTSDLGAAAARQLHEYLDGTRRTFDVPVDLAACTPFQRRVLEACTAVPAGQVVTYQELARQVGRAGAARAVGSALARNPVPILVPCHRVVRGDGGLGGFVAGLEWKRRLLRLEGVDRA